MIVFDEITPLLKRFATATNLNIIAGNPYLIASQHYLSAGG